jgi:hypothetical protein
MTGACKRPSSNKNRTLPIPQNSAALPMDRRSGRTGHSPRPKRFPQTRRLVPTVRDGIGVRDWTNAPSRAGDPSQIMPIGSDARPDPFALPLFCYLFRSFVRFHNNRPRCMIGLCAINRYLPFTTNLNHRLNETTLCTMPNDNFCNCWSRDS